MDEDISPKRFCITRKETGHPIEVLRLECSWGRSEAHLLGVRPESHLERFFMEIHTQTHFSSPGASFWDGYIVL